MSANSLNAWENFARAGAEAHILTDLGQEGNATAGERFFASGQRQAEIILREVQSLVPGWDTAVEIGCGVGRLAIPIARRFQQIKAVDVAPTMLTKLQDNCCRLQIHNITGVLAESDWATKGSADFVWSYWVFQHLEQFCDIEQYARQTACVLRPAGVAYLQFDTRPSRWLYRLRNQLPDFLLPWRMRRGLRRIRRSSQSLRRLFQECGLQTVREQGQDSEEHVFILKK